MSEINYPADWKSSSVEEITQFLGRGVGPSYSEFESNTIAINQKCVRNGAVNPVFGRYHVEQIAVRTSSILKDGDVCINSTGDGTIGRVGLWNSTDDKRKFFVDSHVTIARPIEGVINSKYLNELLSSDWVQTDLERFCFTGSTNQVELSRSSLLLLKLFYPELKQQQKIAKILSTVDNLIEKTQTLIDKYTAIKQGMMADLFTRGIDMTTGDTPNSKGGKLRPSVEDAPELYKQTELGWVPKEWEAKDLGNIAEFWSGYAFKNQELSEHGLKAVRISNLHKPDFPYWRYDGEYKHTWVIESGDLLFSWAGVASSIDAYIYKGEKALLNQHIYNFRIPDEILKRHVYNYLIFFLPQLREEIEGGAGQLHLSKAKIQSIKVPYPPVDELHRIVQIAETIDNKLDTERNLLVKLKKQKKGLMQDLLTGKVRVN